MQVTIRRTRYGNYNIGGILVKREDLLKDPAFAHIAKMLAEIDTAKASEITINKLGDSYFITTPSKLNSD